MTEEKLEELKRYLRIDFMEEDDESDLKKFYNRAKISIKNKVGPID